MKKINKIAGPIIGVFLVIGFAFMLYEGFRFRRHYAFTVGTVSAITPPGYKGSGDYSVVFKYEVNDKVFNGNNDLSFCSGQDRGQVKTLLLGKQFPVVYGTETPSLGFMLLSQDYADKFKYTLPDSVKYYDSVLHCK